MMYKEGRRGAEPAVGEADQCSSLSIEKRDVGGHEGFYMCQAMQADLIHSKLWQAALSGYEFSSP